MRPYAKAAVLAILPGLLALLASEEPATVYSGLVRDTSGTAIAGATVQLAAAGGVSSNAVLEQTQTGEMGAFSFRLQSSARALRLVVKAAGYATAERLLFASGVNSNLEIRLQPAAIHDSVTVVATPAARGMVAEETLDSAHVATVKTAAQLAEQPLPTLGHALASEPGILHQQSTAAQGSPFLRGLTGYQVLNLVDGIRFNNSTFRSGPNQYLAFLEPSQAQRVEAVLGPASVAWGGDALGGAINVVTSQPEFATSSKPVEWHGQLQFTGASADLSGSSAGRISAVTPRTYWLGGLSGRKHNDLRAGGGLDSRNVFHRLFGMAPEAVRDLTGNRQQDSGFSQHGAEARFAARLTPSQLLTLNYQYGQQHHVNGYKDLLGGLGRLISTFEPQTLHWGYARYEKLSLGFLDSLSSTFSFNSQTDGSRRQNLSFSEPLTTDHVRVNAYGYSAQASTHADSRLLGSFGGEYYDEYIQATRNVLNPSTSITTPFRPLYPNGSSYGSLGAFVQGSYQISPSLRAAGGIRFTGVRFTTAADNAYRIPDSSQWFRDITFQSSVQWRVTSTFSLHGVVSRGFRAPNLNDLGALGLNDLGYEVPLTDILTSSGAALLSTDAGESALSKGAPLQSLRAESLMNYELGARFRTNRFYARTQFFDAELYDPIVRRTVLFSESGVPNVISGLPVTRLPQTPAQRQQGVVMVATGFDPRGVKAFVNDGRSRYYGAEALSRVFLTHRLTLEGNFSYILGRDLFPNRNIRRLPPSMGALRLRYAPSGRKPWMEFSVTAAGNQSRFSGGDRDDERIGAAFRRTDIASFYRGSRVAALTTTPTGVFFPTGETLSQIQNRVLPIGATINGVRITDDNSRVPLYLSTAGWAVYSVRGGYPLSEMVRIDGGVENLLDRNYRFHGSGVDAPGVNAWAGIRFVF